jgi:hypothetical protein
LNPIPTTLTWNPPRHHHWIAALFVADVLLFVTSVAMTGLMTASTSFVTVVEEEEDAIDLEVSIRPLLSPPFPMLLKCAVIFNNDGWGFASKKVTITKYDLMARYFEFIHTT